MIDLTRLNGHPLMVNCDLIKYAEQSPDTVITLINGEKIVVKESTSEVVEKTMLFRRSTAICHAHYPLVMSVAEKTVPVEAVSEP